MLENLLEKISLDTITPSPTNPRKRFDEKDLEDLAASIKEHGVMQPILVRMTEGGQYEIVAGERRWRASKIAGQSHIPAIVRDLDDIETLQLQIIENLQRSDLHPLEQADGFRQMLNATSAGEHKPWSVDELAAKVGKSRSYIYESLNLCKLSTYAKDKFLEGKFGRDTALLISRIPGEALQAEAIKTIIHREFSYRLTKDYIRRDFTFNLADAKWDKFDEKLLPDTPSCAKCPKRSGNFPELHPDIDSPDVCTDIECFRNKKAAHAQFCIRSLPRVIHGEEAKEVAPFGIYYMRNGYISDPGKVYVGGMPAAQILDGELPDSFTLVDDKNNVNTIFKEADIVELATKRLEEKIEKGELTKQEIKPSKKSEHEIRQELKSERVKQLNPILADYFKNSLLHLRDNIHNNDLLAKEALIAHIDEHCFYSDDTRDLMFDIFGHAFISEFSTTELLLVWALENEASTFELRYWDLDDETLDIEDESALELLKTLENLTGLAPPPLPAAQAQEIEADESLAEAPTEAAAPDPVETSGDDDIAPGALPDIEPAETAGDPTPAAQAAETSTPTAPLSNFDKIRLQEEARRARKAQRQSQKVSASADVQIGADQVASANHTH